MYQFDDDEVLSGSDIIKNIWLYPRNIFRYIDQNNYNKHVPWLMILFCAICVIDSVSIFTNYESNLACILVTSLLFGWGLFVALSFLICLVGRRMQGEANFQSVIRVLTYSFIPYLFTLIATGSSVDSVIFVIFVKFVSIAWSFCFMVIGVSEVQNFSNSKAVLNILISLLIFVPAITALIYLINTFTIKN